MFSSNVSIYSNRFDELAESGVRWIYRGVNNSNTFSNDIEPEYITFNTDQSKAYISLQVSRDFKGFWTAKVYKFIGTG